MKYDISSISQCLNLSIMKKSSVIVRVDRKEDSLPLPRNKERRMDFLVVYQILVYVKERMEKPLIQVKKAETGCFI